MASGDTLLIFSPAGAEYPTSNYPNIGVRNNRINLEYSDNTGNDAAYWTAVMPQHYSNTTGVDVTIHWAHAATTGDVDWNVAWERIHSTHDTDTDGFAADNVNDNNTVPATSGYVTTTTVTFTAGTDMDSVVAGDLFRLRVTRDALGDTAAGDAQVFAVELEDR